MSPLPNSMWDGEGDFCDEVDKEPRDVNNIVAAANIDDDYSEFGKKRLELAFRLKGMGYRRLDVPIVPIGDLRSPKII